MTASSFDALTFLIKHGRLQKIFKKFRIDIFRCFEDIASIQFIVCRRTLASCSYFKLTSKAATRGVL